MARVSVVQSRDVTKGIAMRRPADYSELLNLPVADRLALIEQLWDSVADSTAQAPLHPAIAAELHDRLGKHEAGPAAALPWDEVKRRLQAPR